MSFYAYELAANHSPHDITCPMNLPVRPEKPARWVKVYLQLTQAVWERSLNEPRKTDHLRV